MAQRGQWSEEDCAGLLAEINDLKNNVIPEVNKLYGERGYDWEMTLAAIGFGSLEVAEAYRAIISNPSSISLGIGGISLDTPRTAIPRNISPVAVSGLKWTGRILGGIGTVFSAREALNSQNSTTDRLWATADTAIGAAALYPAKDPLTSATVGAFAAGYFGGRFIDETIDYGFDVGSKRASFYEAKSLQAHAYDTLSTKEKSYSENCP